MSANTAHASNGVLLYTGEYILIYNSNVLFEFINAELPCGEKTGSLYMTTHRLIYLNDQAHEELQSFNAPLMHIFNVKLEQAACGMTYLYARVWPQAGGGNINGVVEMKIYFPAAAIIDFAHALLRACTSAVDHLCQRYSFSNDKQLYAATGSWHQVSAVACLPPAGFYSWLPKHAAFEEPLPIGLYVTDLPPPYAGIGAPPSYGRPRPKRVNTPPTACVPQQRHVEDGEISLSHEKLVTDRGRLAAGELKTTKTVLEDLSNKSMQAELKTALDKMQNAQNKKEKAEFEMDNVDFSSEATQAAKECIMGDMPKEFKTFMDDSTSDFSAEQGKLKF